MQRVRGMYQWILRLVLVTGLVGAGTLVFAQGTNGSLTGQVTDPSGAALSPATVTLTNVGTNFAQTAVTDSTGVYLFKLVPPGNYSLEVSVQGLRSMCKTAL